LLYGSGDFFANPLKKPLEQLGGIDGPVNLCAAGVAQEEVDQRVVLGGNDDGHVDRSASGAEAGSRFIQHGVPETDVAREAVRDQAVPE
jgi:hypothetical protein